MELIDTWHFSPIHCRAYMFKEIIKRIVFILNDKEQMLYYPRSQQYDQCHNTNCFIHSNLRLLYMMPMKGPSHKASLLALLPWPTARMTTEKKRTAEIGGWKVALSFFECPWENLSPFRPLVTLQTRWTLTRTVASMWEWRLGAPSLSLSRSPQGGGYGAHTIWGVAADVFSASNYIPGPSSWGSSPLSWRRSFSCPSSVFSPLCLFPRDHTEMWL